MIVAATPAPGDDWKKLKLDAWRFLAAARCRVRPCPPIDLRGLHYAQIRARIIQALQPYEVRQADGSLRIELPDVMGRIVHGRAGFFALHLYKDSDHAAYAPWIPMTLLDPIEVWDLEEKEGVRRYYLSAYRSEPAGDPLVHYVSVSAEDGTFCTGFRKDGSTGMDGKRKGELIYRCY